MNQKKYVLFKKNKIMKANDLSQFHFEKMYYGHYRVRWTTLRGDYYEAVITDMVTIDRTLHADWAKLRDIKHLSYLVKRFGSHYHPNGSAF